MRVSVDKSMCVGCGLCASVCAEVFELDAEGKAEVVADTTGDNAISVQEAVECCPVGAIG